MDIFLLVCFVSRLITNYMLLFNFNHTLFEKEYCLLIFSFYFYFSLTSLQRLSTRRVRDDTVSFPIYILYLQLCKCLVSFFEQYLIEKKTISQRKLDLAELKCFHKLEYYLAGVVLCLQKIFVGKPEYSRSHSLNQQKHVSVTFFTVFTNDFEEFVFQQYPCLYKLLFLKQFLWISL